MGGKVPPGLTLNQANLAAKQLIDVSTHGTSLSIIESAASSIVFVGALSADTTFQIGDVSRCQRITNSTTGSYRLSIKRGASGVVYPVPQNETIELRA